MPHALALGSPHFDLQKALKEGYDKAGINIPFPQTEMRIVGGQLPK